MLNTLTVGPSLLVSLMFDHCHHYFHLLRLKFYGQFAIISTSRVLLFACSSPIFPFPSIMFVGNPSLQVYREAARNRSALTLRLPSRLSFQDLCKPRLSYLNMAYHHKNQDRSFVVKVQHHIPFIEHFITAWVLLRMCIEVFVLVKMLEDLIAIIKQSKKGPY